MRLVRCFSSLFLLAVSGLTLAASDIPAEKNPRLLVENALIFTLDSTWDEPFLGHLLVASDGSISEIAQGAAPLGLHADLRIDAKGFWMMPGFISAHSHLWQSAFSGIAADENLEGWLDKLYGEEAVKLSARDLYLLTQTGASRHLNNGITSVFNFTYTGSDKTGQVDRCQLRGALDSGIRVMHGLNARTIGNNWTPEQALERADRFLGWAATQMPAGHYLGTMLAGAGGYGHMPMAQIQAEAQLMRELNIGNQQHYLESAAQSEAETARYPAFKQAGMVGAGLIFGHFIHSTPALAADAAAAGVGMTWNPMSNGRLGSGFADVLTYRKLGMKVGMGVDGEASSDRADPFENMRMGLYQVRAGQRNASAMTAREVLRMHTLGSAEVLGIDAQLGSLAPGKRADFLLIDPQGFSPYKDAYAALVFAGGVGDIHSVYIDGRRVQLKGPEGVDLSACDAATQ